MPGFELSTHIARPPVEVWAVLTDLEAAPAWMPGIEFVALDEDGPVVEGSIYRFRVDGLKGDLQKGVVTNLRPPQALTLSITRGQIDVRYHFTLEPDGDGTAVRLVADCEVGGWLSPVAPLLIWLMRRSDAGLLDGLADAVQKRDKTRQNATESIQESPR